MGVMGGINRQKEGGDMRGPGGPEAPWRGIRGRRPRANLPRRQPAAAAGASRGDLPSWPA
jgi:hypothetical protein